MINYTDLSHYIVTDLLRSGLTKQYPEVQPHVEHCLMQQEHYLMQQRDRKRAKYRLLTKSTKKNNRIYNITLECCFMDWFIYLSNPLALNRLGIEVQYGHVCTVRPWVSCISLGGVNCVEIWTSVIWKYNEYSAYTLWPLGLDTEHVDAVVLNYKNEDWNFLPKKWKNYVR